MFQTQTMLTLNGFHNPIYNQVNHQRLHHVSEKQRAAQQFQAETVQVMNRLRKLECLSFLNFFKEPFLEKSQYLNKYEQRSICNKNQMLKNECFKKNFHDDMEQSINNLTNELDTISFHLLFFVFLIISFLQSSLAKLKTKYRAFQENHLFYILIKCKCLKILTNI